MLLAGCGLAIILAYWAPRFITSQQPAVAGLLIFAGVALFGWVPGIPEALNPLERPLWWEFASEIAVIAALFGTGLRLDKIADAAKWQPAVRLLLIAMPLCIVAVTIGGWLIGMTLASAVLLAAVLVPTDPVLAAEVQVGGPLEGGEHPIRFALTTEAGLNDGLAFPFVYLAILLATAAAGAGEWLGKWVAFYVLYKIVVGALVGALAGWLLGKVLFGVPHNNPLAKSSSGVIALAGVLVTYGASELIEGYGFIAAFVMGLVLRRVESNHEYHARLHNFTGSLEHAITAVLLVFLGGTLPALWPYLSWPHAVLGLALIFLIRPVAGMAALLRTRQSLRQRAVISFYGVRGLGSIYYLAYAGSQLELVQEGELWATVAFTIVASTIVHGFSAGYIVSKAIQTEPSKQPS